MPAVAFRLMQELPVKVHVARKYVKRDECSGLGFKKSVVVDGKVYESISKAAEKKKVSRTAVHKWLRNGRARYE